MEYEECETLKDIAEVLNEDKDFDIFAYQKAIKRIGGVLGFDGSNWAFRYAGNGKYERLSFPRGRFVADEVEAEEVPDYAIAEIKGQPKEGSTRMKYEDCKTLADVAQALNDDESPCFDIYAYHAAVERVGAVYIPEGTYWACIDRGGGVYDVLARIGVCGPFCVHTVNERDISEDDLAELRKAYAR